MSDENLETPQKHLPMKSLWNYCSLEINGTWLFALHAGVYSGAAEKFYQSGKYSWLFTSIAVAAMSAATCGACVMSIRKKLSRYSAPTNG